MSLHIAFVRRARLGEPVIEFHDERNSTFTELTVCTRDDPKPGLLAKITGVRYHPSSVWRILRALGWTLRLPPRARRKKGAYVPREWEAPARSVFTGD